MKYCDNIFDKIQELLGSLPGHVTILEEQIDADVQTAYHDYASNIQKPINRDEVLKKRETIFESGLDVEDKKHLLVQLASIDSIEAYRTLEKYIINHEVQLKDWATLAYKESRLLIESKLMDESQILISTGLGGKGLKLRYFTALISEANQSLSNFQQKIIADELAFAMKKFNGEVEEIRFDNELCTIISIIPLQAPVHKIFDEIVAECNQYGGFICSDYFITNVKVITNQQLRKMIAKKGCPI